MPVISGSKTLISSILLSPFIIGTLLLLMNRLRLLSLRPVPVAPHRLSVNVHGLGAAATCGTSTYKPPLLLLGDKKLHQFEIIHGDPVPRADALPWMAALRDQLASAQCSATVISARYALSAAHCLHWYYSRSGAGNSTGPWPASTTDQFVLSVGTLDWAAPNATRVRSRRVIPHPNYTYPGFFGVSSSFDIALIELAKPLQFSSTVQPICLSGAKQWQTPTAAASSAIIAGWGLVARMQEDPTRLLHTGRVQIAPAKLCKSALPNFSAEQALCAKASPSGICHGDSGGPLLLRTRDGKWSQIGVSVATLGRGICHGPDLFMRVSTNCAWINDVANVKCTTT